MEEMIRPRLYGDSVKWAAIIDYVRQAGLDTSLELLRSDNINFTFDSGTNTILTQKSSRIKNLDDLIAICKIDLDKWLVDKHTVNSWEQNSNEKGITTLHQVKAFLRMRGLEKPDDNWTTKWLDNLSKQVSKLPDLKPKLSQNNPILVTLSDLHIGAIIQDDRVVEDYNVNVCVAKLDKIAQYANETRRPIHIAILGDLIESFTGKNKQDTWKQIELHGAKVALTAFDVLYSFFSSLHNLQAVYLIGGNHDRITDDKKDDNQSQVAELLYGMFKRMTSLPIEYDPLILQKSIDGISYLFMHGDKLIKNKNAAEIVLNYGKPNEFNLLVSGHKHNRIIRQDKVKFRDITIPSIVTGSGYERDHNWDSLSGFVMVESLNGTPKIIDFPL